MRKNSSDFSRVKLRARDVPELGTLKDLVRFVARRYADDAAYIIPGPEGETQKSFRAFAEDIDALGAALFGLGLKDCHIAILGGNSYAWIVSYFAVANGGNTAVPLDRDLPAEELAPMIEHSNCAALIYAPDYEDMLPCFREKTGPLQYIRMGMDEMEALLAQGRRLIEAGGNDHTNYVPLPHSLAAIVYTSGTTGKSKGVMLTHRNIAADAASICRVLSGAGRGVLALPLHHTFGLLGNVIVPLMYGGCVYISKSVRTVQKDLVRIKATAAVFVPVILETIYKKMWETAERASRAEKMRKGLRLSRFLMKLGIDVRRRIFRELHDMLGGELYLIVCGGAPLNERIVADFCAMGIDVLNGYGITECAPVVSINPQRGNRIGSAGLPLDCCRVRIDAPDENGVGEIQVKGDNVMPGYYEDERETRAAFTQDGWFKTGDLGTLDKGGYLYVTGRIKHLIILGNGKNVSPEGLEEKIKLIPGVSEIAVYAEEDRIVAEVYADPGAGPEAEAAIRGAILAMNRGQPAYKHIAIVKFRDTEFPKTTTMKIKKQAIGGDERHGEKLHH